MCSTHCGVCFVLDTYQIVTTEWLSLYRQIYFCTEKKIVCVLTQCKIAVCSILFIIAAKDWAVAVTLTRDYFQYTTCKGHRDSSVCAHYIYIKYSELKYQSTIVI